jgi:hypothetical protein
MIKEALNAIIERIAEIPELNYVGIDCGQLRAEQPAVKWPCALVNIRNIQFTQTLKHHQTGEADVVITMSYLYNTPSSSKNNTDNSVLKMLHLLDSIHEVLYGWRGPCMGYFERTSIERSSDIFNGCEIWEMVYHVSINDEQ